MKALPLLIAPTLLLAAGCGHAGAPANQTSDVRVDVGGLVTYSGDPAVLLDGVTITFTDLDGETFVATTNVGGVWTLLDLRPGVYTERFERAGYETQTGFFSVEATGENDVTNIFIDHPQTSMPETQLTVTVSAPLAATLRDGDDPVDGFGFTAIYRPSVDGTVTATMDRVLVDGILYLYDSLGGEFAVGDRDDTSGVTVFTIDESDIDALNSNTGLMTDGDPMTFDYLYVGGEAYGPIHGDLITLDAVVTFNAAP